MNQLIKKGRPVEELRAAARSGTSDILALPQKREYPKTNTRYLLDELHFLRKEKSGTPKNEHWQAK